MKPLIINNPEAMEKVRVITVKNDIEKTLKALHKIGALHIKEATELTPVDKVTLEKERRELSDLLTFVNNIIAFLPKQSYAAQDEEFEVIYARPFAEISKEVRELHDRVNSLQEKASMLTAELDQFKETAKYLVPLANNNNLKLSDLCYEGEYLISRVFIVSSEYLSGTLNSLKKYLVADVLATVDNESIVNVIAEAKDKNALESLISENDGKAFTVPSLEKEVSTYLDETNSRINDFETRINNIKEDLQKKIGNDAKHLLLVREALESEKTRMEILEKAAESKYAALIEGWVPKNNVADFISELRQDIEYAYIENRPPRDDEEPPTKLNNAKGINFFQVIISLFGAPKYREWDPTPIVSYFFAIFFGIMVMDVFYGLGIALLAKFLLPFMVDDKKSEGFQYFQRMIYICCSVAIVGGVLTGGYFGDFLNVFFNIDSLALAPAIEHVFQDPLLFIVAALALGFVHINLAHIITTIKYIKDKKIGGIISEAGIFLLEIAGFPLVAYSLMDIALPFVSEAVYAILPLLTGLSVVMIIVGGVMSNGGLGAITWLFDVTGIFGDIMSYARLAGVGLATYYLASSFNMMAGIFTSIIPGPVGQIIGIIIAIIVIFAGHVINMVLTAMTGFVHSLRLCFVEFLFKFYEGGGEIYNPFKLRKRATLLVEKKS